MNIEELFDNELYHNYGMLTTDDANCLINYLKTEVMDYVAGLQKELDAEHEAEFDAAAERFWKRIAELEAQLKNAKEHASSAASWLQRGWISKAAEEIEKIGGDV